MNDCGDHHPVDATQDGSSGLFDDPAAVAAADARALAEIAAERLVSHAAVMLWLDRWGGTDATRPIPL